jgi:general secretion pathway protein N
MMPSIRMARIRRGQAIVLGVAIAVTAAGAALPQTATEQAANGQHNSLSAPAPPDGEAPSSTKTLADNPARTGNPLWVIPLDSLTATRQKPIFSPSRRPPPIAAAPFVQATPAPAAERPSRPPFSLVGAIAGEHDGIAILVDDATKLVVRLKTGESHSGWALRKVSRREVILQRNQETAVLSLPPALAQ